MSHPRRAAIMESENMFMRRKGIPAFFSCALFGISVLLFGGTALAATAPLVQPLKLTEKRLDDKGNAVEVEVKMNGMSMPGGVTMDGNGNVYVADPITQNINIYNSNGKLIKRFRSVNVPIGVSVNETGTQLYVSGNNTNGTRTIFTLNNSGVVAGNLGLWTQPSDIAVTPAVVYGVDTSLSVTDSSQGVARGYADGVLSKTYGPFSWRVKNETLAGTLYADTRHTLISTGGLAVSGSRLFVTVTEYVEWGSATATTACGTGDTASGCYLKDGLYWYPAGDFYWVAMIDVDSGKLLKIDGMPVKDDYSDIVRTFLLRDYATAGSLTTLALYPKGLALDGKDRLYVATAQGMKVFDRGNGAQFTGFGNYVFNDVVSDERNGNIRLLATANDSVYIYGIDGGTNPADTQPSKPVLISPVKSYANSTTPTLEVANSTDSEADPLTYAYEITDVSGKLIASSAWIVEGSNGRTSMLVGSSLNDNTLYHWKAQSFDGNMASDWSEDAEFCVNEKNDSPEAPGIISPINAAPVSPFGSVLAWNASEDPDCYDTVSYVVEISGDQTFGSASSTSLGGTSIGIASGLVNGKVYYWRVKAADNTSESAYSTGSFTYRTTVVKFESELPDAKVYIDGNYGYLGRSLGAAPVEVQDLTPGSHFVTFVKAGYEPVYKIVIVADPLADDSALTVTAMKIEWGKASRIGLAASGTELFRTTGNSAPFVVDYNNDGLKDVIAGDADGNVYLYLSEEHLQEDGSKKAVLVAKGAIQNINVDSRAVPFVVDYDNDGKKDLLVGSGDGHIYLYINTRDDAAPEFTSAVTIKATGSDIAISNSAPNVVDYNNDGKKDLVVGGAGGTLRLYINIGTDDASPEFSAPALIKADNVDLSAGINSNSKVFFTDWNSDGKKDMVVGGSTVNLFLNVGTDDAPSFVSITGLQQWIKDKKRVRGNREFIPYLGYSQELGDMTGGNGEASPFVVDWDGTSARDVVVGNGAGSASVNVTVTGE